MKIRTTTSTVVSFTEQSIEIALEEQAGAIFFEDRKAGQSLSVELTGNQLIQLCKAIATVNVKTWQPEDEA